MLRLLINTECDESPEFKVSFIKQSKLLLINQLCGFQRRYKCSKQILTKCWVYSVVNKIHTANDVIGPTVSSNRTYGLQCRGKHLNTITITHEKRTELASFSHLTFDFEVSKCITGYYHGT